MFRALIAVTGIGPKMALGILSGITVPDLRSHILTGNAAALTGIPGVGRKTAERLVVELREKVGKRVETAIPPPGEAASIRSEAVLALLALGYNRPVAEQAIAAAMRTFDGPTTLEQLIKTALKHAAR